MEHKIIVNGNNEKCKFQIKHIVDDDGFPVNQYHRRDNEQDQQHEAYLHLMECRLEFKTQRPQEGPCIFKYIGNLGNICGGDYQRPNVVSIGPYHQGNDKFVDFNDNKWYFLKKLVLRMSAISSKDLGFFIKEMRGIEKRTRGCYMSYGDVGALCSYDFVEMMLLDSCFIIEFLRFLGRNEDGINRYDDPVFITPSIVPLLIADLLKLENQLPFFVLESLFTCSVTSEHVHGNNLLPLIMEAINLTFPVPNTVSFGVNPPKHLLELVYKSLLPNTYTTHSTENKKQSKHKSNGTIQCVTKLKPSGIKLKARKSVGFLNIDFKDGVLEIPAININNFTMNLITNCFAWEQCSKGMFTYFTDYIYFMNCLINGQKDVALLCGEEIITRHSRDDASVVSFFNSLGKNITVYNSEKSYLSREMREIEAYYSSNWATIMRSLSAHNT